MIPHWPGIATRRSALIFHLPAFIFLKFCQISGDSAMPIYEYRCDNCGHAMEVLQRISDAPRRECPKCKEPALRKLVSAAGFRLKGTGWYATDFKHGNKPPKPAADKGSKPGSDGAAKSTSDGADKSKSDSGSKPAKSESSPKAASA